MRRPRKPITSNAFGISDKELLRHTNKFLKNASERGFRAFRNIESAISQVEKYPVDEIFPAFISHLDDPTVHALAENGWNSLFDEPDEADLGHLTTTVTTMLYHKIEQPTPQELKDILNHLDDFRPLISTLLMILLLESYKRKDLLDYQIPSHPFRRMVEGYNYRFDYPPFDIYMEFHNLCAMGATPEEAMEMMEESRAET